AVGPARAAVPAVPKSPGPAASANSGGVRQASHVDGPGNGGRPSRLPATAAAAKSVGFGLDRSMGTGVDDGLGVACAEILAAVRHLSPSTRFQVVTYNRRVETVSLGGRTGLVPADARTVQELDAALQDLVPEGDNDHAAALRAALA